MAEQTPPRTVIDKTRQELQSQREKEEADKERARDKEAQERAKRTEDNQANAEKQEEQKRQEAEREKEQRARHSGPGIGAIVLIKNPLGGMSPAIVIDDFGEPGTNLKLAAFFDSGQRMGVVDVVLVQDAQPEPDDLPESEQDRSWTYWRAL